jgi:multidrug efflux pump subunit AcrB
MRAFRRLLTLSMANPVRTVALSLVLPVLGLLSLPLLTPQFFPGVDRDQFHIEVDLPPGTGIAETLRVVREIDARSPQRRASPMWPGSWAALRLPSTTTW